MSIKSIKQISIFLENKSGRLAEVTNVLAGSGLNIRALSLADASSFGEFRIIVDSPEQAYMLLKERHYTVKENEVLAIEIPDQVGELAQVLQALYEHRINVEYLYEYPRHSSDGKAIVVFHFDDLDKAAQTLLEKGITLLTADDLYKN